MASPIPARAMASALSRETRRRRGSGSFKPATAIVPGSLARTDRQDIGAAGGRKCLTFTSRDLRREPAQVDGCPRCV
jgi:hypothetical protein